MHNILFSVLATFDKFSVLVWLDQKKTRLEHRNSLNLSLTACKSLVLSISIFRANFPENYTEELLALKHFCFWEILDSSDTTLNVGLHSATCWFAFLLPIGFRVLHKILLIHSQQFGHFQYNNLIVFCI